MVLKQNKKVLKWKEGKKTCKYINKLASHVRAWEGEEIEWKIIKVHPNKSQKKVELVIKIL
jgi:hypothetical protein